jgi:uncharacterized protein (DUF427 family)
MRVKAIWNGQVLAESDQTVRLGGNYYFPTSSLDMAYFQDSDRHTVCPWKGIASYYDVVVDGEVNRAAAWYYPKPSRLASSIIDHVAFWNGVKVVQAED